MSAGDEGLPVWPNEELADRGIHREDVERSFNRLQEEPNLRAVLVHVRDARPGLPLMYVDYVSAQAATDRGLTTLHLESPVDLARVLLVVESPYDPERLDEQLRRDMGGREES